MQKNEINHMINSTYLSIENQYYIEQLYKEYLNNSDSIESGWKKVFDNIQLKDTKNKEKCKTNKDIFLQKKYNKIKKIIQNYRIYGHINAKLDPLNLDLYKKNINLTHELHNFTKNELNSIKFIFLEKEMKLKKIISLLDQIYCSCIGIEYMHINNLEEKKWIEKKIEIKTQIKNIFNKKEKIYFLSKLIAAETLEKHIGFKFPGAKRFSLEGAEALIPMLKYIIQYSSTKLNTKEIILGMAHRGRINVLVNIFGKKTSELFDEFSGKSKNQIGSGDVKYHQGFSCKYHYNNLETNLTLEFNPSHLEIINPVVAGSARATIDKLNENEKNYVLPITIHGDSSIIGQGVVQETLNMSQVRGYNVGGTIRIVVNNQIGFTTSNTKDSRTSTYCTDIIKMINAPIFHVNSDDIESVIFITKLATQFRNKFKKDVIIDLVCYRRHGHNEADEPSATQPIMYQKIKKHPTICEIYSNILIKEKIITYENIEKIKDHYRKKLDNGNQITNNCKTKDYKNSIWKNFLNHKWNEEYQNKINLKELKKLAKTLNTIPKNINMQNRVKKIYQERLEMVDNKKPLDWGAAETLAYATILNLGINIRISGEDSSRGTFFHRHAIIHDQTNGNTYIPLSNINKNQGNFNIWDSVLSEEAALAFEYGYASTNPKMLIIWEAQFGDFANGAQVVIDQFISSSEQKWGKMCGLVMLLPHGYEGQGPEHSSARIERYLQLCAQENMQICIPSTPSQIYNVLMRQTLRKMRKPLIIISPKSLLRHNLATSSIEELLNNKFKNVIDEIDNLENDLIKRIILCSGKIYYDLLEERRKNNKKNIAIIRIEQLYPFPYDDLEKILIHYKDIKDFIWCQEEPLNQGAWIYNKDRIKKIIPKNALLNYIGRKSSASPAVGYMSIHQKQQKEIIKNALQINK